MKKNRTTPLSYDEAKALFKKRVGIDLTEELYNEIIKLVPPDQENPSTELPDTEYDEDYERSWGEAPDPEEEAEILENELMFNNRLQPKFKKH